ncbi:hypothetical protein XENORESO_014126 [Xenotaenia resolanae]|uniref:Uncharacterized protein n=1 Tax=Xenotaenia resolanae TaxID=208358 RepID=A0ABV0WCE8_9TELE
MTESLWHPLFISKTVPTSLHTAVTQVTSMKKQGLKPSIFIFHPFPAYLQSESRTAVKAVVEVTVIRKPVRNCRYCGAATHSMSLSVGHPEKKKKTQALR